MNLQMKHPLKITFQFTPGEEYDLSERIQFWDAETTVQWFRAHGYILYKRVNFYSLPDTITEDPSEGNYPYAYHDTINWDGQVLPLRAQQHEGIVVFAQDSQQRHIAIKLVRTDSEECRILRFISQQSPTTLKENCIIPVLDFLPANEFCLVVMPRWGSSVLAPQRSTYGDVLQVMHSMLKGLSFLHRHNIVHRDIKHGNVLVNHFGDDYGMRVNQLRADLRSQGRLSYAIFDFDISIMVPPEIRKDDYRLPYHMSWWGTYNWPKDTAQGEFDYNPFCYDVGCLGVEFCECYQVITKEIPMLAPLLDRMTTRKLQQRFTAAEALEFFEARYAELPESLLETMQDGFRGRPTDVFDKYDRWANVPPDFAAKWASYREPPIPFTTKILRSIVGSRWVPPYIIPWIRWFFFRLSSPARRLWTHTVGLRII